MKKQTSAVAAAMEYTRDQENGLSVGQRLPDVLLRLVLLSIASSVMLGCVWWTASDASEIARAESAFMQRVGQMLGH